MSENEIIPASAARRTAERQENEAPPIELGTWVWVLPRETADEVEDEDGNTTVDETEKPAEWFGCVVHVGSNFVKVKGPLGQARRIHFDRFDKETRPELDPRAVIGRHVEAGRGAVSKLLEEVKAVTARLGVSPVAQPVEEGANYALAALSSTADVKEYEKALEKAKKEELPELFAQIKAENELLGKWMGAELLPLSATAERAQMAVTYVEERIFNVSLYAGLTEDVVQFAKGEPARADAKLHVFQTRLYMDEESLLGYEHGGLEFDDIREFDKWMAKPKNRDRLLPFPRTLIAMRVRRNPKHRSAQDLYTAWININLAKLDETTFFYMRNGDRLYRMNCDEEFGELIFPAKDEFLAEPSMARVSNDQVQSFMTVREYEAILARQAEDRVKRAEWFKANPYKKWRKAKLAEIEAKYEDELAKAKKSREDTIEKARIDGPAIRAKQEKRYEKTGRWRHKPDFDPAKHLEHMTDRADSALERAVESAESTRKWRRERDTSKYDWQHANPYSDHHIENDGWEPFDPSSVYYDEARKEIHDQIKSWNRIALIIQGLYDRSEIFHPHPPVALATPQGFAAAIELVYDGSHALEPGPAPDFEAYRRAGLAKLETGSVTIGQKRVWLRKAKEEFYAKHGASKDLSSWWSPNNDDGPGYLAVIAKWNAKTRQATYRWLRGPRRGYSNDRTIPTSVVADEGELFNVSAYNPGDYIRFYEDPRTRRQYLRWAPLLLTGEEYYAGNQKAQAPDIAWKKEKLVKGRDGVHRTVSLEKEDTDVEFTKPEPSEPDEDDDDEVDDE